MRKIIAALVVSVMRSSMNRWWLQRDSNPRFSLERAVTWLATTRTYGVVATGGCHGASELELQGWETLHGHLSADRRAGPS